MTARHLLDVARHRSRWLVRKAAHTLRYAPYRLRTGYNPTGERVCPDFPDENFENHMMVYAFASQFARGRDVLDVGCGTGYGSALLAERGASAVIGIDRAKGAVGYARKRYGNVARFAVMDAQSLGFESASFDLVISSENLEHLRDPEASIREARRVLRAGGLLLVGTPNKEMSSPGKARPSNPYHVKEFYFSELRDLLMSWFSWVVVFENSLESTSATGRRMRSERAARGALGLEAGDLASVAIDDLTIDLRDLRNTHSFVALARDR